jgi:hypothetical protein
MHAGRLPKQGFRHFLDGTFDCFKRPAQVHSTVRHDPSLPEISHYGGCATEVIHTPKDV